MHQTGAYELGFLGQNAGDWFNLINQGIVRTGVADSDTHSQWGGVSGFPHNVAFVRTGMADAVKAQFNANLGTARMADLSSQMYLAANEGFTMSFAGIPAGQYEYNCTPHLAMNMKGVITVQ